MPIDVQAVDTRERIEAVEPAEPIESSLHIEQLLGKVAAAAALAGLNDCLAFVVDQNMRLLDANDAANAKLFDTLCARRHGRVVFRDAQLAGKVARAVAATIAGCSGERCCHVDGDHHWVITFGRLPSLQVADLVFREPKVLIAMRDLRVCGMGMEVDLSAFTALYELTPTEERLCRAMVMTCDLAVASKQVGITHGHARQRLKVIFRKTQTVKQSDLCILLARYMSACSIALVSLYSGLQHCIARHHDSLADLLDGAVSAAL
ncbi:helix-turn-helix transcriptional regulator [Bradyrhizobium genosp. P]|uniref:helix-turn-helix transcriptional regulator n=1 Tax=Bradyrhizobium genosp. P TaxID=83641 RepID=UPI003CE9AED5